MAKTKRSPRKRIVFHVVYDRTAKVWDLVQVSGAPAGRRKLWEYSISKQFIVTAGRRMAERIWRIQGKKTQLKVHGKNGKFQFEATYGDDPRRYKS